MVRTIYQIVNHESDQEEVFETEEQAENYIQYLKNRQEFEYHEQANNTWDVMRWPDELVLYDSAEEAITAYEIRRGKPISGEERYEEFKKKFEESRPKKRRLVDDEEFERFIEWKKTTEATVDK